MPKIVYPYGTAILMVASGDKIAVASDNVVSIYKRPTSPNFPAAWIPVYATSVGESYTTFAFTNETEVRIEAAAAAAYYAVGPDPSVSDIVATDATFRITGLAADQGGYVNIIGGASLGSGNSGGAAKVTGGAATSGNATGGSVVLAGGAKSGTGVEGAILHRSAQSVAQGAPTAKTMSAGLTAAEIRTGIITINHNGSLQLPTGASMDAGFPDFIVGDAFDFSFINIATEPSNNAGFNPNTGWTLVGDMAVMANTTYGTQSSGRFRAAKTGNAIWVLYRLS